MFTLAYGGKQLHELHGRDTPMYKLGFEEAEEEEIRLPTFIESWRKQESSRKTRASLTTLKPLTGSQKIVENLKEMEVLDHLTYLLRNLYAGQEAK